MANKEWLDFDKLVSSIWQVHENLAAQTGRAVNIGLTMRNWTIGLYIREFEQSGADRSTYGSDLFHNLSCRLKKTAQIEYHPRELRRCREFYLAYPEIGGAFPAHFDFALPPEIQASITDESREMVPASIRGTLSPQLRQPLGRLVKSLSFSHFVALISLDDPLKRVFYEAECIRGNWSVRELKRQISSLYYERCGLSENKEKLAEQVQSGVEKAKPELAVRDPYIFEFLGIRPSEVMSESDLEDRLLRRLEEFLLELGHGFCFEARQKRVLIGDSYGYIDLVFYHRILKCHILVELKIEEFTHQNIGQLNTYVSWYRKHMMSADDNPPIGLLLCTRKDKALVEYALAGMDNHLFVSKYQLQLPNKTDIQQFLEGEIMAADQG